MKSHTRRRHSLATVVVAAAFAIALAVTPALPASANQISTGGTAAHGEVKYWPTARTNTYQYNTVRARLTYVTPGASLSLWVALRNSAGTTYARGNTAGAWATIVNDNGNYWNPPGTFYLNTQLVGSCVGAGCAWLAFEFDFAWNVPAPV